MHYNRLLSVQNVFLLVGHRESDVFDAEINESSENDEPPNLDETGCSETDESPKAEIEAVKLPAGAVEATAATTRKRRFTEIIYDIGWFSQSFV